ncbi:E3 ubiquitin-protein ligase Siah1, partial [Frankliniella fusca]
MIALVRSTTATTHALMLPHGGAAGAGAAGAPQCRGPAECTQASLHCACQRVAMAKELVRVVEGLNRTAGRVNEATDFMIKLSNSLSPREALKGSCVEYLTARVEAAEGAVRSITQVQSSLQLRVHTLGVVAGALWSRGLGPGVEATPERDRAVEDLRSMMDSASTAVTELSGTADTLQSSVRFLREVLHELHSLQAAQACPAAGAALLEQLECPVCYQASAQASDPMWTCANGHVVCGACRLGVLTCPVCRGPLATRPALLLAAWASALRARCPWGCDSLLGLQDRAKHHEACERRADRQDPD